jgi:hypothetical protein
MSDSLTGKATARGRRIQLTRSNIFGIKGESLAGEHHECLVFCEHIEPMLAGKEAVKGSVCLAD